MLVVMSPFQAPAEQYPESRDLPADAAATLQGALAAPETERIPTDATGIDRQLLLEQAEAIHGDLGSRDQWVLVTPGVVFEALVKARDHYRHLAEHDKLTGLVNQETWRSLLRTRLELGQPTGILMLDLNKFKTVNDTLGHEVGDELLADFGSFLRSIFKREEDHITETTGEAEQFGGVPGRTGGDEFRIIVDLSENNRRGAEPYARMDSTYEYLASNVATFVSQQPENIRALGFGAAIGVAVSNPNSALSTDEQLRTLLKQADESMYEEKPEDSR
jgi:diguanylate cyclase (GGDEF)-like protein